jgi:hypothetical protein
MQEARSFAMMDYHEKNLYLFFLYEGNRRAHESYFTFGNLFFPNKT